MLAEITQKRIDDAQKKAEIAQLNESSKKAIILSPLQIQQNKQEEIANLLSQYSRNTLLQIARDNGISQIKGENKKNLIERMYNLDPTKVIWSKYKKLKRQPKK